MDIKSIFQGISSKLLLDFKMSSEIQHHGNKGAFRENALSKFLSSGRLPQRYGIGSGEVIGHSKNVSKQCDLIIYDQLDGISLLYDESIQVYPIETVFGVIEVKSTLNKKELLVALENIKALKSLSVKTPVSKPIGAGFSMTYPRSTPFGIIFAYRLSDNSLESLRKNIHEWESQNAPEYWPNLVIVLGEGIIEHRGHTIGTSSVFLNEDLDKDKIPLNIEYKEDSLFQFYTRLIDLCTSTNLGSVNVKVVVA